MSDRQRKVVDVDSMSGVQSYFKFAEIGRNLNSSCKPFTHTVTLPPLSLFISSRPLPFLFPILPSPPSSVDCASGFVLGLRLPAFVVATVRIVPRTGQRGDPCHEHDKEVLR